MSATEKTLFDSIAEGVEAVFQVILMLVMSLLGGLGPNPDILPSVTWRRGVASHGPALDFMA